MIGSREDQKLTQNVQITYNNCMKTRTVNISLPIELVEKVDRAASLEYATRSDYIRAALLARLRASELNLYDKDGNGVDLAAFIETARNVLEQKTNDQQNNKIPTQT